MSPYGLEFDMTGVELTGDDSDLTGEEMVSDDDDYSGEEMVSDDDDDDDYSESECLRKFDLDGVEMVCGDDRFA